MTDLKARLSHLSEQEREKFWALIEQQAEEAEQLDTDRIPKRADTCRERTPLSFAQQRLWFLDHLLEGKGIYNIASAYRLEGILKVDALREALNTIVQRHEILRTTFEMSNGEAVQHIHTSMRLTLPVLDMQAVSADKREQYIQKFASEEARRPFDLEHGPLLRAILLQFSSQEHIFLLTVHHIVTDDWSTGIFLRELSTFYTALSKEASLDLPALPLQYADFALWQRQRLQGEVLEQQLAYWTDHLQAPLPLLALPTDHARSASHSYQGATAQLSLDEKLQQQLHQLSHREGTTFFMTIFAAFQVLLARYSGQQDLLVGTVIANRDRSELVDLIGFFVNTLVLRTDVSDNPRFLDLLKRVRSTTLDAYAHPDVPFEKLVEVLQPQRDPGQTPLFQVFLTVQNNAEAPLHLPHLHVQPIEVKLETARFEMTWSVSETHQGINVAVEYRSDLFEAATIQRMLTHFAQIVMSVVRDPLQRVTEISLLTSSERRQIVEQWNQVAMPYEARSVPQRFEQQVERTPHAPALHFGSTHLSYTHLNRRANQLAHALQAQGVGPETRVGLCLPRSPDLLVALLAILKAGGAYVPLDPTHPQERLRYILADAGIALLVTQSALVGALPQLTCPLFCLDQQEALVQTMPPQNPAGPGSLEHLAYIIYTSGSTGRPKGVQLSQHALSHLLVAAGQVLGLDERDRVLAITTLSFDIAALELYLPLLVGAQIVLAPGESLTDGSALLRLLQESEATFLQATPATWRLLLAAGWSGTAGLKAVSGGEALPADLAAQLLARVGSLYNMYGPTETTIYSTVQQIQQADQPITIGRPLGNTQLYILDRQGQPVPLGVAGELFIGGEGLARGYLQRPELTAERFVPDPFSQQPGARLYCTGDLARYRQDGQVEYLGRQDGQVKVRGYRIELGEIEAVLNMHAWVQRSVVVAHEYAAGDKRLVAYLVRNAESEQEPEVWQQELRQWVRARLPDYMVPTSYVPIEEIPLTPSGKVDRKRLPAPALTEARRSYVAPRSQREQKVATIWQDILHYEQIGIYDNFFELGGHSLLATQVISGVKSVFNISLPLKVLFEQPTIAGLVEEIECHLLTGTDDEKLAMLLKQMEVARND